jgi:hypothetical protein
MTTETEKNNAELEKLQDIPVSILKNVSIATRHKDANADVSNVEKKPQKLTVESATTEAKARRPTPAVAADNSESAKEEKPSSSYWADTILRNNANPMTDTHLDVPGVLKHLSVSLVSSLSKTA